MTSLSEKSYWKIGGNCNNFNEVNDHNELYDVVIKNEKIITIGNGTNILFDSNGYDGCIVKLGSGFRYINLINDDEIEVGASYPIPHLVRFLSKNGLGGIDHCIGIPATLGGLVTMNGGSQRRSISENIISVNTIDHKGKIKIFSCDDCKFGYRDSIFKNNELIITSVRIKLDKINPNSNRTNLLNILSERRNKFPRKIPNCGSVFKSSPELFEKLGPPGAIIESLGLKGLRVGGAEISKLHANFILNTDSATSDDIISIVSKINKACYEKFAIELKSEAIFYDKGGEVYQLEEIARIKDKNQRLL